MFVLQVEKISRRLSFLFGRPGLSGLELERLSDGYTWVKERWESVRRVKVEVEEWVEWEIEGSECTESF
ncbi:hypothetical protein HK098_006352, partial [Nowakowskiella sp. JEL0407]